MEGEWWEDGGKKGSTENVLPSPFFLPVMYKKSSCTEVDEIPEIRHR